MSDNRQSLSDLAKLFEAEARRPPPRREAAAPRPPKPPRSRRRPPNLRRRARAKAARAATAGTATRRPTIMAFDPGSADPGGAAQQHLDKQGRAYATGRRKDAVARVWLKPGSGKITVNGRDQEVYFARPTLRLVINQPFGVADRKGQYDVIAPSRAAGFRARPARSSTASPGADQVRADPARARQGRRLPDPRQPHGRAQEVRQGQGPPQLPVLEALKRFHPDRRGGPATGPFSFAGAG